MPPTDRDDGDKTAVLDTDRAKDLEKTVDSDDDEE